MFPGGSGFGGLGDEGGSGVILQAVLTRTIMIGGYGQRDGEPESDEEGFHVVWVGLG